MSKKKKKQNKTVSHTNNVKQILITKWTLFFFTTKREIHIVVSNSQTKRSRKIYAYKIGLSVRKNYFTSKSGNESSRKKTRDDYDTLVLRTSDVRFMFSSNFVYCAVNRVHCPSYLLYSRHSRRNENKA